MCVVQLKHELEALLAGEHDESLSHLPMDSLKINLPTFLHVKYQVHKTAVDRAVNLAIKADLTKTKIMEMKAAQKKEEEEKAQKQARTKRIKEFTDKMKAVCDTLGLQWKQVCGLQVTQELLKFCEKGDHSDEGTTCLLVPTTHYCTHIRIADCLVQN